MGLVRARLLAERQRQFPLVLNHPSTRRGFAVELPEFVPPAPPARWRDANGAEPSNASVATRHAEFTWTDRPPPATFTLVDAGDHTLARVIFDADGGAALATAAGVRGWAWLAPLAAPDESPIAPPAELSWQVVHGPSAAATWHSSAPTHRLDLVSAPDDIGLHQRTLALVDATTGWALVGELTLALESAPNGDTAP